VLAETSRIARRAVESSGQLTEGRVRLAIDLFCGLGGWTEGLLAEGYYVVGFDIERHDYGTGGYPAQLVLQDVLTLHGKQFKDAALIVASPPCQEFSYMAMPWSKAKEKEDRLKYGPEEDRKRLTALFDACFRIQREACEAAGRHIPLVIENVRGAQKWVGQSRWNYGSFHLWGDVPALMPMISRAAVLKPQPYQRRHGTGSWFAIDMASSRAGITKPQDIGSLGQKETNRNPVHELTGRKGFAARLGESEHAKTGSQSKARKAASAAIARIPFALARYIARVWA
jgi:hypothetical protein